MGGASGSLIGTSECTDKPRGSPDADRSAGFSLRWARVAVITRTWRDYDCWGAFSVFLTESEDGLNNGEGRVT